MHVQRVAMPASPVESWTVVGGDGVPVEPAERYLGYLTAIERSPNTIRAYAFDLKDYWVFLQHRSLDWQAVRLEDIGEYVAWLRLPPAGRQGVGIGAIILRAPGASAATLAAIYGLHRAGGDTESFCGASGVEVEDQS